MKVFKPAIRYPAILLVIAFLLQIVAFAADSSAYEITISSSGVTSSCYDVDETTHQISSSDSATKFDVTKTYILRFTENTFSIANKVGKPIPNIGTYTLACTKGVSWGKDKTKTSSELSAFKVQKTDLAAAGYTNLDSLSSEFYYCYFDWAGTKKSPVSLKYAVLIEITSNGTEPEKPANLEALTTAIGKVTGANAELYYQADDHWNGKTYSEAGFWADMQTPLKAANDLLKAEKPKQDNVDTAAANLEAAIANLIPKTEANTSALYKVVHAAAGDASLYTKFTWQKYETAKAEAETLLGTYFDADTHKATSTNTPDAQDEIDAATKAADTKYLVRKSSYDYYYALLADERDEAEALLAQYSPETLTESDYSEESWAAFVSAYDALKEVIDYRIVGGTWEDFRILKAYNGEDLEAGTSGTNRLTAFKNAFKSLVSSGDVTVSFTYINNFAALYPSFRHSGTDLYVSSEMALKDGAATLYDVVENASLTMDTQNDTSILGGELGSAGENDSDTNPYFLLFVNGEYYGYYRWAARSLTGKNNTWKSVQLHNGDDVQLVRVSVPVWVSEESSGYDSTRWNYIFSDYSVLYRDSIARITMQTPSQTVHIGDKANFSAAVTGAGTTNRGQTKSSENITLFISNPSKTETLSQPTHKTTATTDASGNLKYIFREPGYYTVAMFNVTTDEVGTKDVTNIETPGEYYSLYVGDYAMVYVEDVSDTAALLTQYRAENLAKAKAYFEQFHDYDFTSENYQALTDAYNALKSGQTSATSFKALMDAFDTDYAALQAAGANALDHAAIIAALRKDLSYLPDDLATLTTSDKDLVLEIQTAYAALNYYQKSLLTAKEKATLEQLAKINAAELKEPVTVTVTITQPALPYKTDSGSPNYGWPDHNKILRIKADGTTTVVSKASGKDLAGVLEWSKENVAVGDTLEIRRYLETTEDQYWLVWSTDNGTTWNRTTAQTLTSQHGISYPGYYLVQLEIPKTLQTGDTFAVQLKMVSKAKYQQMFETLDEAEITKLKNAAIAVVEAAFNACKQSEYDADGIASLTAAKKTGKDNIQAAGTETAIKTARDNAVAAIKAVPKAKSSIVSTDKTQYNSGKTVGSVTVKVENTTWKEKDGAPITGTLVSGEYALGENDSMMTMILQALELGGYTWNGIETVNSDSYKTTYIASIDQGEKSLEEKGGAAGAGWMGTLNDWFVNYGYASFTVKNGGLKSGDEIHVMYTMDLGEDLGGSWTNNETTLSSLTFSSGELTPAFSGATTDYLLVIPDEQIGTRINYSAANKNFQTRAYLNTYGSDNAYYANGDIMAVSSGDVIYIGVGDKSWPTMNKASNYTTTRYTITVVQNGSVSDVKKLITDLPSPGKITLANAADVRTAKAQFDLLTDEQKKDISVALKDKLKKCNDVITNLEAAKLVSDAIAALPDVPGTDDIGAIRSAEEAYNKLTDEQKDYLTQREVNKLNNAVSAVSTLEVGYVTGLIAALPAKDTVTAQDRARIDAARTAYNNLTEAQKKQVSNYKRLTDAEEALENLGKTAFYEDALNKVLAYVQKEAPNPSYEHSNSNGTEWAVMSVARGNVNVTVWYDTYLNNTAAAVAALNGNLDKTGKKHTEYERIILALTALGEDATKFKGSNGTVYDLVAPLFDKTASGTYRVSEQGNNGTVFALIALDSGSYYKDATGNAARNAWIETLCKNQFKGAVEDDGGAWNIDGDHPGANVDTTAMAVQALAPYYSTNAKAKAMVDKALEWLSAEYKATGDYGSSESAAQVIVALSAMKIDAKTDARFQYNGVSVLSNFLSYADETTGGFLHDRQSNSTVNQMSSEQAAYTLVAYDRYVKGSNRLYDMSDATKRANATVQEVIDMIAAIGPVGEGSYNAIAEARNAYNKLSVEDQAKVTNYNTLTAAETSYKAILKQKRTDQYKALKAHYDDLLNDKTKKYGTAAKKKLASILQQAQTDMNAAESCERVMDIYNKAILDLDAVKPGDIEVTFRLIGALEATQDVDLTNDSYLPEYVTWVPTTTYALAENATVYDLFTEAMSDAGLRYIGAESNYVSTIYAPSCLGGYSLSEFTNGKKSGWMYTVNGTHPNQGLKNWTLNDNDVVVWHYVNDYSHEVADWFNDPNYPSLGNGTYYNGWLRAADISPEQYVNELLGKILKVGKHGTVEPKLTFQHIGKSVTFTFKPDSGYKVKDVKVNGKSVGAVTTYTIDKLTVSTRIEVEFTDGKLPFTDVHETDWFYNDVLFVYEEGLFAGTSDTTFSPNAAMTRAMLVTVLYRLEGEPAVSGRSGFSDVTFNSYYEDAVTWAADNGIVNGTSITTFSPNANVTREQMAAILYRYAQYKKYNTAASSSLNGFTDQASVSGYATASLEWAVAEKLVNGSAGKLMPTGNATRAQVAAILHRFVENVATTK